MRTKLTMLAAPAAAALLAVPGLSAAAYYYEAMTTIDGARGEASTVRAWVDGANAKIEFNEGDPSGMYAPGSYLLTHDGGETLYLVNPSERTVSEIDLAQILRTVGTALEAAGGVVQMEFTDFTSEQLGQEPGETILGYPTTRHRYKTGYTMRLGVLGMSRQNRTDSEHDIHCTDRLDPEGFSVWLRPDRLRTGNEGIDSMIEQEFADLDCVPLRNRTVTTTAGPRGRPSTMTSTMEVTTLREETPPSGTFVLPEDFTRTSLMPDFNAISEEAAPAEAPQDDGSRRRPRLRDLIGR